MDDSTSKKLCSNEFDTENYTHIFYTKLKQKHMNCLVVVFLKKKKSEAFFRVINIIRSTYLVFMR